MRYTKIPNIVRFYKNKIPFLTILGVFIVIVLLCFLWRPLNLERASYTLLSPQVQTTVLQKDELLAVLNKHTIVEIIDDKSQGNQITETSDEPTEEDDVVKDDLDEIIDKNKMTDYIVSRGDTLHGIMSQYGVNSSDVYLLTKQFKQLANLRIGQNISWIVDDENNLQNLSWAISNNNIKIFEREGDKFIERTEKREGTWSTLTIEGDIQSSFIADAKTAGLTINEISLITKALQWQLDFRLLKKGDKFSVLLSREMFDKKHEKSQLLAVRVKNGSRDYYAILAEDGSYYDINAGNLSQSFLRDPLEKTARISSGFNPRRVNPVTKKVTAHNGIDYAVSRGTPVLSSGDGEVIIAKYSGSAGNFIAIRHGRQYLTRYMHLDKLLVKAGQKVKKGDRIGLSGNTGRSTGPHLHYELHINGKPVNPLTASLPLSSGLTGKSKTVFLSQVKEILPKLAFNSEKQKNTAQE